MASSCTSTPTAVRHTLADAGTTGTIGSNLDDAFAQARESGMTSDTFTQVVRDQILFPITEPSTGSPGMPGPDETLPVCTDGTDGGPSASPTSTRPRRHRHLHRGRRGNGDRGETLPGGQDDGKSVHRELRWMPHARRRGNVRHGRPEPRRRETADLVVDRVTNGKGVMPPFKDSLDAAQIQAVADYVASTAGR